MLHDDDGLLRSGEPTPSEQPNRRQALQMLLASDNLHARYIALDAYTSAQQQGSHGGLDSLFDSEVVDRAVHDCAVRELSAPADDGGGYGSAASRHQAVYALWNCYQGSDAPLVARVLATTDDLELLGTCLTLVGEVFDADPHFDDGLLDTLHRLGADTGLPSRIRMDAIRHLGYSASADVVPRLVAALDDGDHRIVASAALSLLIHDRPRFTALVEPLLAGWANTDDCAFEIMEARRLIASSEN